MILSRATLIVFAPATTLSGVAVASPVRTSSASYSTVKPCTCITASVQPSGDGGWTCEGESSAPALVGERRLGDGDSVSLLRFLPIEDHLTVFLKNAEATLQGVQYQFSRCRGMTSLLCAFNHTTLASNALLKLRDMLISFGEVISFVEHGGGS